MKHVAPGLGVLVAGMLFASPIKAVRTVRQTHQLGVSYQQAQWLMRKCTCPAPNRIVLH